MKLKLLIFEVKVVDIWSLNCQYLKLKLSIFEVDKIEAVKGENCQFWDKTVDFEAKIVKIEAKIVKIEAKIVDFCEDDRFLRLKLPLLKAKLSIFEITIVDIWH